MRHPGANPTERFLREPGDPKSIRIEIWEADFLRPETFNAVIFGTGSVEVQSIEYQVEHRFRFQIPAAELEGLIAAIAAAGPLACPPQDDRGDEETAEHRHPPPTRIVLVNAAGGSSHSGREVPTSAPIPSPNRREKTRRVDNAAPSLAVASVAGVRL